MSETNLWRYLQRNLKDNKTMLKEEKELVVLINIMLCLQQKLLKRNLHAHQQIKDLTKELENLYKGLIMIRKKLLEE